MSKTLSRSSYLEKNVGNFPAEFEIAGIRFEKADDLRYGTNPHQPAAYYRPAGVAGVIGGMEIIKNGKSGLSQTNLEDISGALNICTQRIYHTLKTITVFMGRVIRICISQFCNQQVLIVIL